MIALCLMAQGCSLHATDEAQAVVAQADSLRTQGGMYGIDEGDSARLAQAYETLGTLSLFTFHFSPSYARACYHYGRLLREKDDPVAAMQVFINATHSRTREYYILGRVYNNMGDIAHLAGEFQLSYNMFERSAKMFLLSGDTTAYYYILNDMAFELAEQGKEKETLCILQTIKDYGDPNLEKFTYLTQAKLYLANEQYDSLLLICNKSLCDFSINYVFKARAFEYIGEVDSALYYAQKVMTLPDASEQDKYNMLYILTHYNTDITNEQLLEKTSERADIGLTLDNAHARHAQASEILRQDVNRKPNLAWLYAMLITACIIGGVSYWMNRYRQQQIHHELGLQAEHRTEIITQSIKQHIDTTDLERTLHWKKYDRMKVDADLYMGGIVSRLETLKLNETEIRFCVLSILDFSLSRIAETIHYSYPSGIKTLKKRISVKLGTNPQNLRNFLLQLAANA